MGAVPASAVLSADDRAPSLVKAGVADLRELRQNDITTDELLGNRRMNGNVGDVVDVSEAWFERAGKISVIRREKN